MASGALTTVVSAEVERLRAQHAEAVREKSAAPGSIKVPEVVKAAGAGGTKSASAGAAKARELPSPGKRVADFGTDISVDDYLTGKSLARVFFDC